MSERFVPVHPCACLYTVNIGGDPRFSLVVTIERRTDRRLFAACHDGPLPGEVVQIGQFGRRMVRSGAASVC